MKKLEKQLPSEVNFRIFWPIDCSLVWVKMVWKDLELPNLLKQLSLKGSRAS